MKDAEATEVAQKVLDPKTLMAEAERITGLGDYGDSFLYQPFVRFMHRAACEVSYRPGGLEAFHGDVIRMLVNRLRTIEDVRQHPEILDEDVSDPIVITGLPRSGTTKLQRMLAVPDNVQKLPMWKLINPARTPEQIQQGIDRRAQEARQVGGLGGEVAAERGALQAAHAVTVDDVEEEIVLFDFVLDHSITGMGGYLPLLFHGDWAAGAEERLIDREAYRYLRLQLQYLQWQDGGRRGRPWILKCISHLAHMECVLENFPKATLVQTHRNPALCVPSSAKLMHEVWSLKTFADKKAVGRDMLGWNATMMRRELVAREQLQLDNRIIDVRYEDVRSNAMAVIERIYERANWKLSNEAKQAMRAWEERNEQGKHGEHRYSLEEFGLDQALIDDNFRAYMERFSHLF